MAYDSESDRIILFGGELEEFFSNKVSGATWAYDAGNNLWTQMKPTNEPIGVMGPAMAYDSESDRVIMLGGLAENGQFQKKTWAYDYNANTWSEGTTGPEIGAGAEMVYDSESDRIVLFGGWAGSKSLDETWVYDVNTDTWENMEPDNTPPARRWLNMVYDIESDRVILWEGETATTDNVWSYDFNSNTWMEHALDGAPSLENFDGFGAMVYDSESDRSISYGGGLNTGSTFTDTMWVYDYNTDTWTEMVFEDGPGGRTMHRMAYNSALDLIILFGGLENTNHPYSQETWAYDFNTNTWTNMTPEQK